MQNKLFNMKPIEKENGFVIKPITNFDDFSKVIDVFKEPPFDEPLTLKDKLEEYDEKYGHIPKNNEERLKWLIDSLNLSPSKMDMIIEKKRNMEEVLDYYTFKIVLYEDPEGAMRPRFRLINRSNIANAAIASPNFIHVYSPNAANDHRFLHRLLENELLAMNQFIQTPCQMNFL